MIQSIRIPLIIARQTEILSRCNAIAVCVIAPTFTRASQILLLYQSRFGAPFRAVGIFYIWNTNCFIINYFFVDNVTAFGSKYLKTCDSQSNALAVIVKETEAHGSNPITLTAPPCDPDGSYSSKQCSGSQCYCRTLVLKSNLLFMLSAKCILWYI